MSSRRREGPASAASPRPNESVPCRTAQGTPARSARRPQRAAEQEQAQARRAPGAATMVGREKELKIHFVPGRCELVEVSGGAGNLQQGGFRRVRNGGWGEGG